MAEPILAVTLVAGYTGLAQIRRRDTAMSSEAREVHRTSLTVRDYEEASIALFGRKASALNRLHEVLSECSESDWDGYGAEAYSPDAAFRAEQLIRSLPDQALDVEFGVEPDGTISFDWDLTNVRNFSLIVGESDRIAYAWIDGTDRGHAVARMASGNLPDRILNELQPFLPDEPTLRAA